MKRLLCIALLAAAACGKRGDPQPPVPIIPQATSDLVVTQRGRSVILSWSYPSLSTAGKTLAHVESVTIYRHVEEPPTPQPGADSSVSPPDTGVPRPIAQFSKIPPLTPAQFSKLKEKVETIESDRLAGASVGARLTYEDSPPFQTSDGRPVRISYAVVTTGGTSRSDLSNLASIVPLEVPAAPSGLTATAEVPGVRLEWKPGQNAAAIVGYNVYRSPSADADVDLNAPANPSPVKDPTFVDAPPYGTYKYRVTAVASAGPPRIESEPSEIVSATFKDLTPPPPPATVTPLVETKAVRLIWDPVDAPDFAGYRIYRAEGIGHGADIKESGFFPIMMGPVIGTTWTDVGPSLGIAYRYGVSSLDKNGNESKPTWTEWVVAPKTP